jgi:hypothetical protein
MVKLASINLYEGFPVEVGDARYPTGRLPDVIHSHGLLEHFSDEDIRKIIKASCNDGARVIVHYVPSDRYEQPSFGDERLMSAGQWHEIVAPHNIIEFNDGYDLALVWDVTQRR